MNPRQRSEISHLEHSMSENYMLRIEGSLQSIIQGSNISKQAEAFNLLFDQRSALIKSKSQMKRSHVSSRVSNKGQKVEFRNSDQTMKNEDTQSGLDFVLNPESIYGDKCQFSQSAIECIDEEEIEIAPHWEKEDFNLFHKYTFQLKELMRNCFSSLKITQKSKEIKQWR